MERFKHFLDRPSYLYRFVKSSKLMNDYKSGTQNAYKSISHLKNKPDSLILKNEVRRRIFNEILQSPGIHCRELQRRLGVANGTVAWHIGVLKESTMIKSIKGDYYTALYPSIEFQKGPLDAFIPSTTRRKILECIRGIRGITQKEISEKTGMNQSTVLHHLRKLIHADFILEVKDGKCLRYFVYSKDNI